MWGAAKDAAKVGAAILPLLGAPQAEAQEMRNDYVAGEIYKKFDENQKEKLAETNKIMGVVPDAKWLLMFFKPETIQAVDLSKLSTFVQTSRAGGWNPWDIAQVLPNLLIENDFLDFINFAISPEGEKSVPVVKLRIEQIKNLRNERDPLAAMSDIGMDILWKYYDSKYGVAIGQRKLTAGEIARIAVHEEAKTRPSEYFFEHYPAMFPALLDQVNKAIDFKERLDGGNEQKYLFPAYLMALRGRLTYGVRGEIEPQIAERFKTLLSRMPDGKLILEQVFGAPKEILDGLIYDSEYSKKSGWRGDGGFGDNFSSIVYVLQKSGMVTQFIRSIADDADQLRYLKTMYPIDAIRPGTGVPSYLMYEAFIDAAQDKTAVKAYVTDAVKKFMEDPSLNTDMMRHFLVEAEAFLKKIDSK